MNRPRLPIMEKVSNENLGDMVKQEHLEGSEIRQ